MCFILVHFHAPHVRLPSEFPASPRQNFNGLHPLCERACVCLSNKLFPSEACRVKTPVCFPPSCTTPAVEESERQACVCVCVYTHRGFTVSTSFTEVSSPVYTHVQLASCATYQRATAVPVGPAAGVRPRLCFTGAAVCAEATTGDFKYSKSNGMSQQIISDTTGADSTDAFVAMRLKYEAQHSLLSLPLTRSRGPQRRSVYFKCVSCRGNVDQSISIS